MAAQEKVAIPPANTTVNDNPFKVSNVFVTFTLFRSDNYFYIICIVAQVKGKARSGK